MTAFSDRAIILGRERSGETSLVVQLLCRGRGRMDALAKGALGPGSALAPVLDMLHEVDIVLKPSARGARAWVREAVMVEPFAGMRADFPRFELACHFAALVALCVDREHPSPEIYDLLRLGLGYLDAHGASLRLMLRFERRLLEMLGLGVAGEGFSAAQFGAIFGQNFHALPPGRGRLLKALPRGPT
ncbi:MAG: DNA repair protein RecO [Verrucomicrobiae bacterium]|nr:DNA repair protein RecO [Verrucomicrobiae bacterium]